MNNMPTPLAMVREFATRMDQPLDQIWGDDEDLEEARFAFIREEFQEIFEVLKGPNYKKCNLKDLVETNR